MTHHRMRERIHAPGRVLSLSCCLAAAILRVAPIAAQTPLGPIAAPAPTTGATSDPLSWAAKAATGVATAKIVPGICSTGPDYAPSLSSDGRTLYFSTSRSGTGSYDVWSAERSSRLDSLFGAPGSIGPPVNTDASEGSFVISSDGQTAFYVVCSPDCGIYSVTRSGDAWINPQPVPGVSSEAWESNPMLSSDGRSLYFSSTRPGGLGGTDIYVSRRDGDGLWTVPQNVGAPINTAGDDEGAFVLPGGNVMYFASNGRVGGLGGFDLYVSRRDTSGAWGEPVSLGPAYNSSADDRHPCVAISGDAIFFSSNRTGRDAKGSYDLYTGAIEPLGFGTLLNGRVYDRGSGAPVAAGITFTDSATGAFVRSLSIGSRTGRYAFVNDPGTAVTLYAHGNAPGFGAFADTIRIPAASQYTEIVHDFPLGEPAGLEDEREAAEHVLHIAPNPASGSAAIHCPRPEHSAGSRTALLIDARGSEVRRTAFTGDGCTFDLTGLANGMYLVRVGDRTTRLVVMQTR